MSAFEVVAAYSRFLSGLRIVHVVGGSLASSAWGEQRATNDADFLLHLTGGQVDAFLERIPSGFFVQGSEVRAAAVSAEPFASFQALYEPTSFKIDNFVANDDWQRSKLARARLLEIQEGRTIPFASAEDMIVAKCRWFELGNRVSDRQWNDLVRLYEVQYELLDRAYIEKWLAWFGLMDLWADIQRQSKLSEG
jgi:hypothetical protein